MIAFHLSFPQNIFTSMLDCVIIYTNKTTGGYLDVHIRENYQFIKHHAA